jgi:hypothetical protein
MPEQTLNLTAIIIAGLSTVTGGAIWVGKLQQRLSETDRKMEEFRKSTIRHEEQYRLTHGRLTTIEADVKNIDKNVTRLLNGSGPHK